MTSRCVWREGALGGRPDPDALLSPRPRTGGRLAGGLWVTGLRGIRRRAVFATDSDLSAAVLLMVLGRVRRRALDAAVSRKRIHAVFDFEGGLRLTAEASSHRWSSLHLVRGEGGHSGSTLPESSHSRRGLRPSAGRSRGRSGRADARSPARRSGFSVRSKWLREKALCLVLTEPLHLLLSERWEGGALATGIQDPCERCWPNGGGAQGGGDSRGSTNP